jgi:hypothetical protein
LLLEYGILKINKNKRYNSFLTSISVGALGSTGVKEEMIVVKMFLEGTLSPTTSSCSSVKKRTFAMSERTSSDLKEGKKRG